MAFARLILTIVQPRLSDIGLFRYRQFVCPPDNVVRIPDLGGQNDRRVAAR
jgi:hypothetical protein